MSIFLAHYKTTKIIFSVDPGDHLPGLPRAPHAQLDRGAALGVARQPAAHRGAVDHRLEPRHLGGAWTG